MAMATAAFPPEFPPVRAARIASSTEPIVIAREPRLCSIMRAM